MVGVRLMMLKDYVGLTVLFMLMGVSFYGILELLAYGIREGLRLIKNLTQ